MAAESEPEEVEVSFQNDTELALNALNGDLNGPPENATFLVMPHGDVWDWCCGPAYAITVSGPGLWTEERLAAEIKRQLIAKKGGAQ